VSSGLKTDDGEELSRAELIARIIDPVSFEKVRQGGLQVDAQWRCNRARVKAAHIETLFDTRAPSDAALAEALERVKRMLIIPAAEYVPTIPEVWDVIDAALAAAKGQQPALVRSFGTRELAEAYQAEMDAIGCVITIEEVWLCRAA